MVTESTSYFFVATIALAEATEFVSTMGTENLAVCLTIITSMARKCECISHDAFSRLDGKSAYAALRAVRGSLFLVVYDLLLYGLFYVTVAVAASSVGTEAA